jgi:hypothetical protein
MELNIICGDLTLGGPALFVNDPTITMVHCAEQVFLAAIQVTQISVDGISAPSIIESLLHDHRVTVHFQILNMVQINATANGDWKWTGKYEMAGRKTEGRFVYPVDPAIPINNETSNAQYLFCTDMLLVIGATVFSTLTPHTIQALLKLKN